MILIGDLEFAANPKHKHDIVTHARVPFPHANYKVLKVSRYNYAKN